MSDLDLEKQFFTYLQKQFSQNDFITLNHSFVPKKSSTKLNRFYKNIDSMWFARLNVTNNEKVYYFGLKRDEKLGVSQKIHPRVILKFDSEKKASSIRFFKDTVALLINVDEKSNSFSKLKKLFSVRYATKNKAPGIYFLILGKLNSKELINNIELLVSQFSFELNVNHDKLKVLDFAEGGHSFEADEDSDNKKSRENQDIIKVLKFNLRAIEFKNNLKKSDLSSEDKLKITNVIFNKNSKGDFSFSNNLKIKKADDEIFDLLNRNISVSENFNDFENNLNNDPQINYKKPEFPKHEPKKKEEVKKLESPKQEPKKKEEVKKPKTEKINPDLRRKMGTVIEAFRKGMTTREAASLVKLKPSVVTNWFSNGRLGIDDDCVYYYNQYLKMQLEVSEEHEKLNIKDIKKVDGFIPGESVYTEVKRKFPLKTPRDQQLETISEIVYAINKGYKYIILEAGTGTGKSAIAATLSRIYDSSYILTVTKQLQQQYHDDFKKYGFNLVKGRQNFDCFHHVNLSCDKGDCILKDKNCLYNLTQSDGNGKNEHAYGEYFWKSTVHCPYWIQKVNGLNSKVVIANYDFGLYDFNFSHFFDKRNLLIMDESHNLEDKLMSFISLDLKITNLRKDIGMNLDVREVGKLQKGTVTDWIRFVKTVKEKYDERTKFLINKAKEDGEDDDYIKELEKELKLESNNRKRFIEYISNDRNNWIFDYDNRNEIISFKPLSVKNYTKDFLFKFGDVCIFMSATILNYRKFAKWMGIDVNKIYFIKKDSPFDSSKNPIIIKDTVNMSHSSLKMNSSRSLPIVRNILENHKNEKGLIHTVSGQCRHYLMKNINDNRLMTHTTQNRNEKLNQYKSSKNSVLVSPSMYEGVDLPGEQCRFQIIYKLPFMKLNEQVKKRKAIDEEWYNYRTCISLVQTFGRGIRFDGDYCKTYVVDSRFKEFVNDDKNGSKFLPDYLLNAIEVIK